MTKPRPPCIKHWRAIQEDDEATYPGSDELLSIGSRLGEAAGLVKIGVHHEFLPPGRRTSWPHAESKEEEFVFVIEGTPQVWINGHLHDLEPGDFVGFPAGTGIAHTFINNSDKDVRLLVGGEKTNKDNQYIYPLNAERNREIGDGLWAEWPKQSLGPHDGLPDALRRLRKSRAR
jgi:uncharacterized cupin superfamily protein